VIGAGRLNLKHFFLEGFFPQNFTGITWLVKCFYQSFPFAKQIFLTFIRNGQDLFPSEAKNQTSNIYTSKGDNWVEKKNPK